MVDEEALTERNKKLFEQIAFQAARAIDYRDAVIETDELITDVINMGGKFHSAQSLEIIRQRLRGRLAAAGLMLE